MKKLTAEDSKLLTKIMTLGSATELPVVMSASELAKLVAIVCKDTAVVAPFQEQMASLWEKVAPPGDYYSIPDSWFSEPLTLEGVEHIDFFQLAEAHIPDFRTYISCLSELHKRRRKYSMILSAQPLPTMLQVAPRALMEFGSVDSEALASWLTWRKFFFDLDNRSAQETGYLFEPILAAAIGGVPKPAKAKVVKRALDPAKGRQVDCWKIVPGGKALAYEFKLRVTIAASGQGRFREELEFAEDCAYSGATPVLVVLDPTPNPKLRELEAAYVRFGGHAFVGDAAWTHLEQEAGPVMAAFVENYVRKPVNEVSAFANSRSFRLLDLVAKASPGQLTLQLGDRGVRQIARREDPSLSVDDEEPEDPAESVV